MYEGWIVENDSLDKDTLLKNESIFHVANGYLGVRGNFEENYDGTYPTIRGTFINGFYDVVPITYGEKAFAFPDTMQKIVNITDAQTIYIYIGDEKFSLFSGKIKFYRRYINLREGYYKREIYWISPCGKEMKISITRIASFNYKNLFAVNYKIEKINFDDKVVVESFIKGDVKNYTNTDDPRVGSGNSRLLSAIASKENEEVLQLTCSANYTKNLVVTTTTHKFSSKYSYNCVIDKNEIKAVYIVNNKDKCFDFTKYNVYTDSRRKDNPDEEGIKILSEVSKINFSDLLKLQKGYLDNFWKIGDIKIKGNEKLQQGVRFNLYQLLQSAGTDSITNISAKGLSGEGYEGHYFWDTEIYMAPFFILSNPDIAKKLLKYRYNILGAAKKRALELGHKKGAAYAWRTINGDECSAYFPAGTAQYHLNGDIAYSFIQYYLVTGDFEFIKEFGLEVVIETARIWIEIGHFDNGKFKIDAVTGPDEYTAIVNNNYYTNSIAKYNLKWAVKFLGMLTESDKEYYLKLCKKVNIEKCEVELWKKASVNMFLPYDKNLKINCQDDSFLNKAVWDFKNTPKDKYPLLLNYHPLTIYRYQVLKQADTVLSHFLLEDESDLQTIKNSYDYYEKITTHDSSLSCAVYSIMASKIGYEDKAYKYFIETARLDLDDTHSNTKDGIHTANMGGTWMSIVFGFAGLRIKDNMICFNPKLPKQWEELNFNIIYKKCVINVNVARDETKISKNGNAGINIKIKDKIYFCNSNQVLIVK